MLLCPTTFVVPEDRLLSTEFSVSLLVLWNISNCVSFFNIFKISFIKIASLLIRSEMIECTAVSILTSTSFVVLTSPPVPGSVDWIFDQEAESSFVDWMK